MSYSNEKSIEYVRIATRIMEEEGPKALNIRRVAKEAGCTSAVLYRHFEDKEHLMMVAAVKYLTPYIEKFVTQYIRTDISYIQKDLVDWKMFINEAFHNKIYYDLFFLGQQKATIADCIFEYYQLFPEEQKQFDGLTASIAMSTNLMERAQIALRRAANYKLITVENADMLAKLAVSVFYGQFMLLPSEGVDDETATVLAEECYQLIYELYTKYVNPGTVLDV